MQLLDVNDYPTLSKSKTEKWVLPHDYVAERLGLTVFDMISKVVNVFDDENFVEGIDYENCIPYKTDHAMLIYYPGILEIVSRLDKNSLSKDALEFLLDLSIEYNKFNREN